VHNPSLLLQRAAHKVAALLRRCPNCGSRLTTRRAIVRVTGAGDVVWADVRVCPRPYCRVPR